MQDDYDGTDRRRNIAKDPNLRTVSAAPLLVDGADTAFRETIHNLMALGNVVDALRAGFASLIGVTAPQHELLMIVYRDNDGRGIGVGALARKVRLTDAFIATETNKLRDMGLLWKTRDDTDRRRVVLRLTPFGRERMAFLSAYQRQVNDVFFAGFDAARFQRFSTDLRVVLEQGDHARDVLTMLVNQHRRAAPKSA